MKLFHASDVCWILYVFALLVKCRCQIHDFGKPKLNFLSDRDYRLHTPYDYSNTEFDHAAHDERCGNRQYLPKQITKETPYGIFIGRQIYLCDEPGVGLRDRPGVTNLLDSKDEVRVFLGIPYAKPPIRNRGGENLQFKPPQEQYTATPTEVDASLYKPACPQHHKYFAKGQGINTTNEDCLYLNIFTPVQSVYDTTKYHAVMVYIHDGNFDHGSGSLFPGHMLAASQKVVVVTFNYRLGPLGFLATADENSPGNYGMLDQVKALKWVYENIQLFDGDPKRITVFGSGAGGVSATLLALSPLSKRMIKRVIAQNGSPVADWAAISDPRFMQNTTEIIGERLGCNHLDTLRLVDCVGTRLNEIKILEMKPRIGWLPWGPVVDNFTRTGNHQFLPKMPKDMLETGVIFPDGFAYMTGINRDQGASLFLEDFQTYRDLEINSDTFDEKIRNFMKMYNYSVNAEGIFDALKFMYHPPVDPFNKTLLREAYIHLLTDRYYVAPMDIAVQLMLKNKVPAYAYILNYTLQGYSTILKDFVSSETEYLLLSGAPFMDPKFYPEYLNLKRVQWTEEDRNMSQFMMEAWANFAKDGIPTKTRIFNTILWEKADESNLRYLNLNATNTTSEMIYDYRERESRFWNSLLPFFIDREPPTLAPTLEPGIAELRLVTSALWGSVAVASLLVIITLVCCILYCRIRRKKPVDDLNSSREVIVNFSVAEQDTPV